MLIPKKIMNFCYGMGAAVVIVGALFKITHIEFFFLNGNNMLTVGLLVEALIFAISAFEPADEELDWSRVYPELKGGEPRAVQFQNNSAPSQLAPNVVASTAVRTNFTPASSQQPAYPTYSPNVVSSNTQPASSVSGQEQSSLTTKMDALFKEAKIDAHLLENLRNSIQNFAEASKEIAPTAAMVASTNKYTEVINESAEQLVALNNLYKTQVESALKNTEINSQVASNNQKLKEQMEALTANLAALNAVYGGMLSAMGRNQ